MRAPAFPVAGRAGRVVAALGAVLALIGLAFLVPASADDAEPPAPVKVTAVDASGPDRVQLAVIGAATGVTADQVKVRSGDDDLTVDGVTAASAAGIARELVVVVDTNARGNDNQVLDAIKAQLLTMAQAPPAGLSMAVVSAGDSALVRTPLTSDPAKLTQAVNDLAARNGATLYNGVHRAGDLFSDTPGVIRSVVVVSTGSDLGSDVTPKEAQVPLVANGIQVVSVRYSGGDRSLAGLSSATAGLDADVASPLDLPVALATALGQAADRTLVVFQPPTDAGSRVDLDVTLAGSATQLSYPTGVLTVSPLQLRAEHHTDPTGFAFFRSSVGLYVSLLLAFVGIALGVWSLSSIMLARDSSLEGLLSRYADGRGEVPEADVEELIVQSALLKRAISFSEAFAEKRGFLVRVEDLLEKANLPIRAGEAMFALAAITVFTALFGLLITRSFVAALLLAVFAVGVSFFVVKFLARRRFKKFQRLLPDTLQLLSGTLRAGYSLPQGMEVVSKEIADPMGQELRRAMTEARLGRELEECLAGVSERMASPDFAWAVMAIGIQREVGGNLNELLNSVADTMIARERLRREVGALTAEGRMSAGILSCLPPGLGLIMWIMNPGYISLLFTSFIGNVFLGLGIVSATIGLAWMKKVITIDV